MKWYSWGKKAFQAATSENKPIFLSIGSQLFEDGQLSKLMNETFINIRVDHTQLPEIAKLYRVFAEVLLSSGVSWPLNLILTPDLKPFFAATDLPVDSQDGMMGLKQVCTHINEKWLGERDELIDEANEILELVSNGMIVKGDVLPDKELLDRSVDEILVEGEPETLPRHFRTLLENYGMLRQDQRAMYFANKITGEEEVFDQSMETLEGIALEIRSLLSQEESGLERAQDLAGILEKDFKAIDGAFYSLAKDQAVLLRRVDIEDGGNSIHCENLLRLYQIKGDLSYLHQAEDVLRACKPAMEQDPLACGMHLNNLLTYLEYKKT